MQHSFIPKFIGLCLFACNLSMISHAKESHILAPPMTKTVCYQGDPAPFSPIVSAGPGTEFAWYYKNSIELAPAPAEAIGSWLRVPGAISATYDPPAGATNNRTYALRTTINLGAGILQAKWHQDIFQIVVLPNHLGTLALGNQAIMAPAEPAFIDFSTPPTGTFTIKWYKRAGLWPTPLLSDIQYWSDALQPLGHTFTNTFGRFNEIIRETTTYAAFITPAPTQACKVAGWATGTRQITVTPEILLGQVARNDFPKNTETVCAGGQPRTLILNPLPSNSPSFTYQWYKAPGSSVIREILNNVIIGSILIPGATSSAYNPPAATGSFCYFCKVTAANGYSDFAGGIVPVVTTLPGFLQGSIAGFGQTLARPADPANITFGRLPEGSESFAYQWFYKDGNNPPPTGNSTAGYTIIIGATNPSYDPPAGLMNTRIYACFVRPVGSPSCGQAGWATAAKLITINP